MEWLTQKADRNAEEEEEESRHAKGHLMTSNYVFIQDLFPWFTGPLTLSVHSLSSPLTFDLWPIL